MSNPRPSRRRAATLAAGILVAGLLPALTVAGLFVAKARGKDPSRASLACAGVYVLSAAWMLFEGFRKSPTMLIWVAVVAMVGLFAFFVTRRVQRKNA